MHPTLFKIPIINFAVPTWGASVAAGILLAFLYTWVRAGRRGLEKPIVTNITLIAGILGFLGCRIMHAVHHQWTLLTSGEEGVKAVIRMEAGGEILGGVLLASVGVAVYLRVMERPVKQYFDIIMPALILAMGIGRLGCFAWGCCWGGECELPSGNKALPWAVHFPYGSPPYLREVEQGEREVPKALILTDEAEERLLGHALPEEDLPIPRRMILGKRSPDPKALDEFVALAEEGIRLRKEESNSPRLNEINARMVELRSRLKARTGLDERQLVALGKQVQVLASEGKIHEQSFAELQSIARAEHTHWRHPAQLYDFTALVLLFFLLAAIEHRRPAPGTVVAWTLVLYGANRFVMEMIRPDNPRDFFGVLTVSQTISLSFAAAGVVWLIMLQRSSGGSSPREASVNAR